MLNIIACAMDYKRGAGIPYFVWTNFVFGILYIKNKIRKSKETGKIVRKTLNE